MKISTKYNHVTSVIYTLTTADLHTAIREYVEMRVGKLSPPPDARQEITVDLDGDSHAEAGTLTRRFIYTDDKAPIADAPIASVENKIGVDDE